LSPVKDLGNIEDGQWHQVHVISDGQSISYTFDGVQMSSLSLASAKSYLTSQYAYFGFTGGTGGGPSEQEQGRLRKIRAATWRVASRSTSIGLIYCQAPFGRTRIPLRSTTRIRSTRMACSRYRRLRASSPTTTTPTAIRCAFARSRASSVTPCCWRPPMAP